MFGSDHTTVNVQETNYGIFVSPTERHYKQQFESFFGFGCGNSGFSYDRTVFIPINMLSRCVIMPLNKVLEHL